MAAAQTMTLCCFHCHSFNDVAVYMQLRLCDDEKKMSVTTNLCARGIDVEQVKCGEVFMYFLLNSTVHIILLR